MIGIAGGFVKRDCRLIFPYSFLRRIMIKSNDPGKGDVAMAGFETLKQEPAAKRIREAADRGTLSHAMLFTGNGTRRETALSPMEFFNMKIHPLSHNDALL